MGGGGEWQELSLTTKLQVPKHYQQKPKEQEQMKMDDFSEASETASDIFSNAFTGKWDYTSEIGNAS